MPALLLVSHSVVRQCSERFWSLYFPLAGLRALAKRYQQINLDDFTNGKDELLRLQLADLDPAIPTSLRTDVYFRESYAGVCWCWWPWRGEVRWGLYRDRAYFAWLVAWLRGRERDGEHVCAYHCVTSKCNQSDVA